MPESLAQALALPGLGWIALAFTVAGVVRGFTGFGTALIVVPVAGQFLSPVWVVAVITLTGILNSTFLVPRAWREADRAEFWLLALGAALMVPVGLMLITALPTLTIRWLVAGIAGLTLLAVIAGWRYRGTLSRAGLGGVGGAAGFIGGLTGLTGPVVVIFYLSSMRAVAAIRANMILFLAALDWVILLVLTARGLVPAPVIWAGFALTIPYAMTTLLGQALFRPSLEPFYRRAAYAIVGLAVLSSLPIWE